MPGPGEEPTESDQFQSPGCTAGDSASESDQSWVTVSGSSMPSRSSKRVSAHSLSSDDDAVEDLTEDESLSDPSVMAFINHNLLCMFCQRDNLFCYCLQGC